MEQFTGKSLARWRETHTCTLHEYGAKRQNFKHTLVQWKHLGEHAHTFTAFWGHGSFHSWLQLYILHGNVISHWTFQPALSGEEERLRESKGRKKKNSEHISIFGSWWVRRCFDVETLLPRCFQTQRRLSRCQNVTCYETKVNISFS